MSNLYNFDVAWMPDHTKEAAKRLWESAGRDFALWLDSRALTLRILAAREPAQREKIFAEYREHAAKVWKDGLERYQKEHADDDGP